MNRTISAIITSALIALSSISCSEIEGPQTPGISPGINDSGTITISVKATMDDLTPSDNVKSTLTPAIRLNWASSGDKVFVYDDCGYLGELDVTLDNEDERYAYLSGQGIKVPEEGTTKLTCIHAKGVTDAPDIENGKVTISLARQDGKDSEIPFVVFGTIDYNGQSDIEDQFVNFSFATSVVNVNCTDLATNGNDQEDIENIYIDTLNTSCQLTLSGTSAPSVDGTDLGGITRTGVSRDLDKMSFLMSVPVSQSASGRKIAVFKQTKVMSSSFADGAFAAGEFVNLTYKLEKHSKTVESVSLNLKNVFFKIGSTIQLAANVAPDDAYVKDVTWSSSDESVATVNDNGKITSVGLGTATITATSVNGGKTANCIVRVSDDITMIPGMFSVSDTRMVCFSSGNLRARKIDNDWEWGFYDHQYESGSLNGTQTDEATEIDLFTWGYGPWSNIPTSMDYSIMFYEDGDSLDQTEDWGSVIGDGKSWRTLSKEEWQYLIGDSTKRRGKYSIGVTVCGKTDCLILVPDVCLNSYTYDYMKKNYDEFEWETAEAAGLVCLPAAGYRNVDFIERKNNTEGNYWSSTSNSNDKSYSLKFNDYSIYMDPNYRSSGYSVRLVTDETDETD